MKNIAETVQNVLIALFVALNVLLITSLGHAQDHKKMSHREPTGARVISGPDQGPVIVCKDVGGGVQECLIRDSLGHTIRCHNVGGVCLQ